MRVLLVAAMIAIAGGCATVPAAATAASAQCFKMSVVVTAEDEKGRLVEPGTPVEIIVRSKAGRALHSGATDAHGQASFEVCWGRDDPPYQVEGVLHYGPQFVGTLASFASYSNTYCLTLPSRIGGHCGEWGTGPNVPEPEP